MTNYIVEDNYNENLNINIVFHRFKSTLQGINSSNDYYFQNIPLNEKITIVAMKIENNQRLIATAETTTDAENFKGLVYVPMTAEYLKEVAKKLDNLK
jgi:hypothetical protein